MIGLVSSHPTLALVALLPALLGITWVVYLTTKYAPIIGQKFEEPPLFLPLRVPLRREGSRSSSGRRTG